MAGWFGFPPVQNSRTNKIEIRAAAVSATTYPAPSPPPSSAPWRRRPPSPLSPPAAASAGHRPPPPGARATTAASPLPCRVPGRAPSRAPGPGHPPRAAPSRVKVIAFWTGFIFEFTASLTVLSLSLFSNLQAKYDTAVTANGLFEMFILFSFLFQCNKPFTLTCPSLLPIANGRRNTLVRERFVRKFYFVFICYFNAMRL